MLDKDNFKDLLNYILVIGLFILAFLIIKPIIYSIIYGILLAFIIYPIYKFTLKKVKSENISAFIVCLVLLVILILLATVILGSLLNQILNLYVSLQKTDLVTVVTNSLPEFLASSEISTNLVDYINSSISKLLAKFASDLGNFVLNLPSIMLQIIVVFIILFFCLRDGEKAFEYFRSLSPLKKEVQDKFFLHFKDITYSVLVGQIVIGIIQGIVAGIGYFMFGVPNALLLTVLTIIIGIIPVIGPWLVWIPIDIYLFVIGRTGAGIGLLIYGLILINWIDTLIRPLIVSRRTQINPAVILIGMIGGLFVFGVLGLIIGPLILAYVLLVLELYRKQKFGDDIIFKKIEDYRMF
ncbi:AI-2E family transporter [Candidatus Woesearchaeota archaeon]|nr:AI-2E family transporter [Candidatus Woesearchaeota archaeon]